MRCDRFPRALSPLPSAILHRANAEGMGRELGALLNVVASEVKPEKAPQQELLVYSSCW